MFIFAPLYVLAYLGIIKSIKLNFEKHNWILTLFIAMLVFSVVFSFESRFRTVTLEPFYSIYAAFSAYHLRIKFDFLTIVNKIKWAK